jgi:hypothetical protein
VAYCIGGDVNRTGLAMMQMFASGACSAQAFARSRTIEALVLKRSMKLRTAFTIIQSTLIYHRESFLACEERQQE